MRILSMTHTRQLYIYHLSEIARARELTSPFLVLPLDRQTGLRKGTVEETQTRVTLVTVPVR
jgi:hypothetical protein